MAFPRQWLFILLALMVGAGPGWAATSKKEQRDYDAAVTSFHDGMWSLAETEFSQFIQIYPDSTNVPEAWLFQAQAVFKQGKFVEAETLLTVHQPVTGDLTNAYNYWIGEAQFQRGYLTGAAATLSSLSKDSTYALPAAVAAAAAYAKLGQWPVLITSLGAEQGVFQAAARNDPDNELVLRGRLLLAQAYFALNQYDTAGHLLSATKPGKLPPDLEWQRVYLLCQVKLLAGDRESTLPLATNLLQIARQLPAGDGGTNLAASVAIHATVLEDLGRDAEAIEAFKENLSPNTPAERQRQAILKIAELSIAGRQFTNAEAVLGNYVIQFTNSPATDAALLTLGELYLRDYTDQSGTAALLVAARTRFDQMLDGYTNSAFAGKAYLDRGWCGWLAGDYTNSLADFQKAVQNLPRSMDLAVARFKVGDVLFAQGNYAEALSQYQEVLLRFDDFPEVMQTLGDRALSQSLRAQLQLGQLAGAEKTMDRIAAAYPLSELSQTNALLLGEGYTDLHHPTNALALFQKFEEQVPHSRLRPSVDLAIARAYEEQADWPSAIKQYDGWLNANPTNELKPQALYSQAWANYQAGYETNALTLFTNFVVQFPLHELAPAAQMWVADHYFRLGEWATAEGKYKLIFQNTNWQNSATFTNALYYPAQMMAGRAAVLRTDNAGAIGHYFQKLEDDTNCPLDLRVNAAFAHGSALMKMDSPDTNNPTANYATAVPVFSQICSAFPTNEWGARAWGQLGDCYLQLSSYDNATNAYTQVLNSPLVNIALRSQAQVGLGEVLKKKAALLPPGGADQKVLYNLALKNYLAVFYGNNRNDDEPEQDLYWTKKAGLSAAELLSALSEWQEAINIYNRLGGLMPQLREALARKIDAASQHLNPVPK